ncbi:unnamed protein product (macronuclear) [Paramecium tetraurelia]|uniref:Calponin-homology (CH) domain-containing protein n=1 Tax=Paramecium tetraurelia TaxID=5888 RepID=A0D9K1_PARTE|nr:uncharacterized protein GSPATT00014648001 [Paramecium tetraurelia]CAK79718.1 unnamed protein product [Paramecium tetraurelia]|eukprot:XP_001447115.1 hypothetical protein (macronuclear) [Paramecium tetraurelia strain d4-2]
MKASNIESMSDGRHFLCLLRRYFPEIEVPQFKKNISIVSRIETLTLVARYCSKLDNSIKIDVLKIANKESHMILNLLKFIKSILDKTPIKKQNIKEEIPTIIKGYKQECQKINEEIVIIPNPKKQTVDQEIQTMAIQEVKPLQVLQEKIKKILQSKLQSPHLELEILQLLEKDKEVAILQLNYQMKASRASLNPSKLTEFMSIHSSQFYNGGEQNLLEPEQCFYQNQPSKKNINDDSLFQVSDEKQHY